MFCALFFHLTYIGVLFITATYRSAFFPFIFLMASWHDTVYLYQDVFN